VSKLVSQSNEGNDRAKPRLVVFNFDCIASHLESTKKDLVRSFRDSRAIGEDGFGEVKRRVAIAGSRLRAAQLPSMREYRRGYREPYRSNGITWDVTV
jgi:hypothetical protein